MPEYPSTVDEAVERLMQDLPPESIEQLRQLEEEDLIQTHFGLGLWIRNNYGLWKENSALREDAGSIHPDSVSTIIVERLWARLRE